jgi:excinuclease ABC subunit B
MHAAAAELEFEEAARLRDEIRRLEQAELEVATTAGGVKPGAPAGAASGRSTQGRAGTRRFKGGRSRP